MTYNILLASVEQTNRQLQECLECDRVVPPWLQRKSDAIIQISTDWDRGVSMMIEGLQMERDHLRAVEDRAMEPEKILEWSGVEREDKCATA